MDSLAKDPNALRGTHQNSEYDLRHNTHDVYACKLLISY